MLSDKPNNVLWCGLLFFGKNVKKSLTNDVRRQGRISQLGKSNCSIKTTLELADVVLNLAGNEKNDIFREVPPLRAALLLENGTPGFEVRGLDIGEQTLHEPRSETFFKPLDVRRATIRGEHNLTSGTLKGVEGMEELLLRCLLASNELNIVEQENVDIPKGLSEEVEVFGLKTVDELVDELFRREVDSADVPVFFDGLVGDRVKEVGFSQA